jgi:predicted SprT family Zn-dependent metalloprotease
MVSFGNVTSNPELLAEAIMLVTCEQVGITNTPKLVINGRMGRALGRAYKEKNELHLNARIVGTPTMENTIKHEVAHFLAFTLGENAHGKIWEACAIECGAEPKETKHVDIDEVELIGHRYIAQCSQGCKFSYIRKPRHTFTMDGIEFLGDNTQKITCKTHRLPVILRKL